MRSQRLRACLVCASLLVGCVTVSEYTAVARQASFDLNCPESDIRVVELNTRTYGATGCNRQGTYSGYCDPFGQCFIAANGRQGLVVAADKNGSHPDSSRAGCEYDSQCKGNRICRSGQCVDQVSNGATPTSGCRRGDSVACQASCESGSASSCFNLAKMYEDGDGIEKNTELMVRYYNVACEKGDTSACTNLGNKYEQGVGVERAPVQAIPLYLRACGLGSGYGCASLAGLYEHGTGIAQDRARAGELYDKACKAGNASGCTAMKRLAAQ